MKIKRQRVISYILVLLVALAIPQIASADDPCKYFNDKVTKFVSEMPRLSSSELTFGRFYVENNEISYLLNGRKILKKEWHDSCDPSDEFCKAQITPILGLGGYGGLHIAQQGRHFALTCDHLIFPSSTTNSFKSVSKPWSITVKDLDNDNVSEVISHELQQWALDCDLCLACIDATAWNNIYHFSSEGNLIPVNEHFPQRYAELLTSYKHQYDRFKQDKKSYGNACSSQQLNNQFQALIKRAEKIAGPAKAILVSLDSPNLSEDTEDILGRFQNFKQKRRQILDELVVPIEQCVRRKDTDHVAFHGCIDWHSSVHGIWALVKYTALTGDQRFVSLIKDNLTLANVGAEFVLLRKNPEFEMPYGRAWFLRLALDYHATFNSNQLVPMGDYVAQSLMDYYRRNSPRPFSREYDNASWALINLYDYGVSRDDRTITGFVQELVEKHFITTNGACPVQNEETIWPDFMAVCTTWAYLVVHAAPSLNLQEWLNGFFPPDIAIAPIRNTQNTRQLGINFSRSWGFWRLFKATNDPRYLKLYLDHFEQQYTNPSWWKGDYEQVGHWVAQFGVFALAPVFLE